MGSFESSSKNRGLRLDNSSIYIDSFKNALMDTKDALMAMGPEMILGLAYSHSAEIKRIHSKAIWREIDSLDYSIRNYDGLMKSCYKEGCLSESKAEMIQESQALKHIRGSEAATGYGLEFISVLLFSAGIIRGYNSIKHSLWKDDRGSYSS